MITFINNPNQKSAVITFGYQEIGPYYWVGSCKNGIEYYAGQTFKTPASGVLKRIKLYTSVVFGSADATLSVYAFDAVNHTWKEKRGETIRKITKALENQWIDFELPDILVRKDESLAFKLTCKGDGIVAVAECPWSTSDPYAEGEEWVGTSQHMDGKFQKEFDFAFQGEIEASANAKFI
jgi:hypothetical protein